MGGKRGRKSTNNDQYFGPAQEEAVLKFLRSTDDNERNEIYNKFLKLPLNKMIESIIRKYKLYRKSISFEELHTDTLSFLMTKAHKFENSKGSKAYSYYGTIAKHYVLGLLIKDEKQTKQVASYEDTYTMFEDNLNLAYNIDDSETPLHKFIISIATSIRKEMDNSLNLIDEYAFTKTETKIGETLIYILNNWEKDFNYMEGGVKYNKTSIFSTIKEMTNLDTKDIRIGMKRFKSLYLLLKEDMLSDENDTEFYD